LREVLLHYLLQALQRLQPLLLRQLLLHGLLLPGQHVHELLLPATLLPGAVRGALRPALVRP
jgi:hypothetical protein